MKIETIGFYVFNISFQQVLSENKIGTEGAISICQFLKSNRNLLKVDMTGKYLLKDKIRYWIVWKANAGFYHLFILYWFVANEIGDPAGQCFYEVLKVKCWTLSAC
jgi:hypothetical protein